MASGSPLWTGWSVLGALQVSKENLKVHASALICLTAPVLSCSNQTVYNIIPVTVFSQAEYSMNVTGQKPEPLCSACKATLVSVKR